jgi:hypothetical protein
MATCEPVNYALVEIWRGLILHLLTDTSTDISQTATVQVCMEVSLQMEMESAVKTHRTPTTPCSEDFNTRIPKALHNPPLSF